jgi:hypothetical protein
MFSQNVRPIVIFAACLGLSATPVFGDTIAQCTPTFSDCVIPENVPLLFPFLAISGDVILVPTLEGSGANLSRLRDRLSFRHV